MRCTPSGSRPKLAGSSRPPSYTDYGLREGRHVDPEGNAIPYGSPLPGSDRTPDGSILLAADDPLAVAATTAVQAGDLDTLTRLLDDNPELAAAGSATTPCRARCCTRQPTGPTTSPAWAK
jgi:hypothetical protein